MIEALWEEGISRGKSKEAQEMQEEMISCTNKYYHYYEAAQPIRGGFRDYEESFFGRIDKGGAGGWEYHG